MIFSREINKIPEFYNISARKMPEFYIIIGRKIFFLDFFFFGGGASMPTILQHVYVHGDDVTKRFDTTVICDV